MADPPSLFDAFRVTPDELHRLKARVAANTWSRKARLSRQTLTLRSMSADRHIGETLYACHGVLSKHGLFTSIGISRELATNESKLGWDYVLGRLLDDPLHFKNRTVWLLYRALLDAQRDFALDHCVSPTHETALIGTLLGCLTGSARDWRDCADQLLARLGGWLEVQKIDLSILGGEQITGGDFGIILDIRDTVLAPEDLDRSVEILGGPPRGHIFIPVIFQAKRFTGESADVSQWHEIRGFQHSYLKKTTCASAYLFFENGQAGLRAPLPPLVKPVSVVASPSAQRTTDVLDQSVDLATFLLGAISGLPDFPTAQSPEEALNMILANTSPDRLSSIAVIGNSGALDLRYAGALANLAEEARVLAGKASQQEPPLQQRW